MPKAVGSAGKARKKKASNTSRKHPVSFETFALTVVKTFGKKGEPLYHWKPCLNASIR